MDWKKAITYENERIVRWQNIAEKAINNLLKDEGYDYELKFKRKRC